ncbi:hypothetical protein [Goodfellowiella coeruleoviolacea]|uniref:Anti-sigma-M factor RsmA n=1 Tax=Goodfellowiella coeruleoviolacea TaxID=334858 RepID=A0AAE3GKK4_9PSEU|nr:hypothetical protein [Goodfellowiella coeruleoviolacea]MCP2168954.1 hypothetical protein [Goodfellowiella coeruleoviolacea]
MTGNEQRREALAGPPWSVDLLADLHAEAIDPDLAAELWPRVTADPEASAIIAAFEATQAELADLPELTMPDDVAARIEAALAAEARALLPAPRTENETAATVSPLPTRAPAAAQPTDAPRSTGQPPTEAPAAPVLDLAKARQRRRNRVFGWGGGVLAAAAVAVGVLVATLPGGTDSSSNPPPVAQPPASSTTGTGQPPLALRSEELPSKLPALMGVTDYGSLNNQAGLNACLTASGKQSGGEPVGIQPVVVDGQESLVAVLPGNTGVPGQFRLLVLDPTCGPDHPGVRSDQLIGGR